ncbi:hypothetical protein M099_0383 [Phocaeicola vulgatus str. 3975 RP4]|uniref:Uncharacterized protein n=3 Tax=Phocaeicola vulgatus TaxID=821 RepID=A0A078R2U0_PHOVU|nr:hypothetical protein CUU_1441 [Phocaeicola vulgatus PC510]KDS26902.1 hypothetical protein M098_2162 [Phocaeicola vulgatus str. 3775 SR(B) 19]KDS29670.1 hypothetical protein M097_2814 [Phocaeicola vulgatus str. 3775 SL(B) 10 (iv)]KDS56586.1 hypothetical protein M099_0383 [Phocaeicola vulgatus str. 3975 RP4]
MGNVDALDCMQNSFSNISSLFFSNSLYNIYTNQLYNAKIGFLKH